MTLLTAPKLQPHRHCVFEDIVCNSSWDLIRDVQNRFFYIGSVLKKTDLVRNEFGSDIIVVYYSCTGRYYSDDFDVTQNNDK